MSARMGRRILQALILLAALTWLAALALAQPAAQAGTSGAAQRPGPGAAAQQQRGPQPSPFAGAEDERLAVWAGAWEESVRFAGDPEDKPSGTGRWRAMPFYGLYIVINYESRASEGVYHAHAVMAYDHEAKTYKLWWFDDGANISEYTGNWKDDTTLIFETKRSTGGKAFRERITYMKPSEDEIRTRIEQAFGAEGFRLYSQSEAHRMALPEAPGGGNQQRPQPGKRPSPGGGNR